MPPRPRKQATDLMQCRACGRDERASEGYPCTRCGTFICVICTFRGVTLCRTCTVETGGKATNA